MDEWLNKLLEVNQTSGISQDNYIIEECSELMKELVKYRRKKSSKGIIVEEACDALAAIFILLKEFGVSREEIEYQIVNKCKKACRRYYNHGEV